MADDLPGGVPRRRDAQPIGHVVEACLEELQQDFAGDALAPFRPGEVLPELPFHDAVDPARLLLLPQLLGVRGDLRVATPSLPVLPRGVGTSLDGAFVRIAAIPLKVEADPLPPALAALSFQVAAHPNPPSKLTL